MFKGKRKSLFILSALLIAGSAFAASVIFDSEIVEGNLIKLGLWQSPDSELIVTIDGERVDSEMLPGENGSQVYSVTNAGNTKGELYFEVSGTTAEIDGLYYTVTRGTEETTLPLTNGSVSLGEIQNNPFEAEEVMFEWAVDEGISADYQGMEVGFDLEFRLEANPDPPTYCVRVETKSDYFDKPLAYTQSWIEWGSKHTLIAASNQYGRGFTCWEIDGVMIYEPEYEITVTEHVRIKAYYNE